MSNRKQLISTSDHEETVLFLLEHGADVNFPHDDPPIFDAAYYGIFLASIQINKRMPSRDH